MAVIFLEEKEKCLREKNEKKSAEKNRVCMAKNIEERSWESERSGGEKP